MVLSGGDEEWSAESADDGVQREKLGFPGLKNKKEAA